MFLYVHIMCVDIVKIIWYKLHNCILKVHFLPAVSVMFLLEYTVMLLLITSVKVRSTRTYMCEISSILLKFCARFWQISSKMFVIPPQISSILLNFQCMKSVATLLNLLLQQKNTVCMHTPEEANNAIKAKRKIFSLVSDGDVEESTSLFNAELKFFVSHF